MQTYFDDHYSKMKEEIGINEKFGIEEEDPKLEEVLNNLRGNTDPVNFKRLMRKE